MPSSAGGSRFFLVDARHAFPAAELGKHIVDGQTEMSQQNHRMEPHVGYFPDHMQPVLVLRSHDGFSGFLGDLQRTADIEEVDSSLLADDLPIDAYLDRGFDTWVQSQALE
mgnify:CR=1 FL=1